MTPLPPPLGAGELWCWRIDLAMHAHNWDSGLGAEKAGGRWNPAGVKAVYCSLDPATAIVEVAAHKRFSVLDTVRHVLTAIEVGDPTQVLVVRPESVPNPAWLWPGTPRAGQQAFGADLLAAHPFVLFPSAVSSHSWNLVFDPASAKGRYRLLLQEALAVDPRLHPSPPDRP